MFQIEIPEKEYKVYKKTFLHNVAIKFYHTVPPESSSFTETLKIWLGKKYGLKISDGQLSILKFKSLRLKSADDIWAIKVSRGFIQINLNGSKYVSFEDSMSVHIENVVDLLRNARLKLNQISMDKLNVWPVTLKDSNLSTIIDKVFSDNISSKLPKDYEDNNCKTTIELNSKEIEEVMLLSAGWLRNTDDPLKVLFMLESEAVRDEIGNVPYDEITDIAKHMDRLLFMIFHWSVSDKVIHIMED